jgi:hypothetical protein
MTTCEMRPELGSSSTRSFTVPIFRPCGLCTSVPMILLARWVRCHASSAFFAVFWSALYVEFAVGRFASAVVLELLEVCALAAFSVSAKLAASAVKRSDLRWCMVDLVTGTMKSRRSRPPTDPSTMLAAFTDPRSRTRPITGVGPRRTCGVASSSPQCP